MRSERVPPGVVGFVSRHVVSGDPLPPLRGRLQLPVVDLVEEHLGQLHDGLTLLGRQVAELVLDKIVHPLFKKKTKQTQSKLICEPITHTDYRIYKVCAAFFFFSLQHIHHLPDAGFLERRALLSLQHGFPHLQDGFSQQLRMKDKEVRASRLAVNRTEAEGGGHSL